MAATMKNYNAKCYNLSRILFIFCSCYVLTAQVSALLNKTKASVERDSTFDTNFDGDTLMSGMSRDSVTQTQGQSDQSTCCQHSAVCVVCHSFERVQRRRSFNSHANDLHCFRAAVLSMLSMLVTQPIRKLCFSVCEIMLRVEMLHANWSGGHRYRRGGLSFPPKKMDEMQPDWPDCSQVCRVSGPAPGVTGRKRRFPVLELVKETVWLWGSRRLCADVVAAAAA